MSTPTGRSPAFTAPTPSMEPDSQISTVGQDKTTDWAFRASAAPKNVTNQYPVRHVPNGQ